MPISKKYALLFALLGAACTGKDEVATGPSGSAGVSPAAGVSSQEGLVLEMIDVPNYTYIRTVRGGREIWVAAPTFQVAVGDKVNVPEGLAQPNYRSDTLDRTFDMLYMVGAVQVIGKAAGASGAMPAEQPPVGAVKDSVADSAEQRTKVGEVAVDSPMEKIEGGYSVAEIHASMADLADQVVLLRAKVVKFTPAVMGKNWLHVQDGSGGEGTHDITVTTMSSVKVGDTVVIMGRLGLDRDFGFGYKYAVLIEDAEVTVE